MLKSILKWYYSFIYGKDEGTVIGITGLEYRVLDKVMMCSRLNHADYDPIIHSPFLSRFEFFQGVLDRLEARGLIRRFNYARQTPYYRIMAGSYSDPTAFSNRSGLSIWMFYRTMEFGNKDLTKPFYNNEGH